MTFVTEKAVERKLLGQIDLPERFIILVSGLNTGVTVVHIV